MSPKAETPAPDPPEPPKPDGEPPQPPDFDPDDEATFDQFRRYMDRYYGELERLVDAEPKAPTGPRTATPAGRATGDGGTADSKPALKPKEAAPSEALTPGPSGGRLFQTLFGVSKAKRNS